MTNRQMESDSVDSTVHLTQEAAIHPTHEATTHHAPEVLSSVSSSSMDLTSIAKALNFQKVQGLLCLWAGTMHGYYPVRVLPSKTAIAPVNPTFLPRILLKLKHNAPNHLKPAPAAPAPSKDAKTTDVAALSQAAVVATPTKVVAAA
ncbi:hypothetical protein LWI29_011279 [Acer saccharum]|uniref:Uncharacterized protein n=1 Tax=Acer saccharum TaxID=4024 RepID=A0AA39SCY3_ACESA|nr:hypothetical protein LWI29_011279 [Acer saccharum]